MTRLRQGYGAAGIANIDILVAAAISGARLFA
jgi:hypothetical protein